MRKRTYRDHWKALVERDKMICQLCFKKIKDYYEADIDHIIEKGFGGSDDISNLQITHKKCNQRKETLRANGRREGTDI